MTQPVAGARHEFHTSMCCLHPYYGFVCTPGARLDFSATVPEYFSHRAVASIDVDGFRNRARPGQKPADEIWIGFFGGSVAFGTPCTSNETTIAACLERRLNAHLSLTGVGRRARVINFALPAGQQPQQTIVCLLNRPLLDGVICFDGVNEFIVPAWYNRDAIPSQFPYLLHYEALYGRAVSDHQLAQLWLLEDDERRFAARSRLMQRLSRRAHQKRIERLRARIAEGAVEQQQFKSLFPRDEGLSDVERVNAGAQSWHRWTTTLHRLCEGIDSLFVLQPVPEVGKPLSALEQSFLDQYPDVVDIRRQGYSRVRDYARVLQLAGVPCEDLSDVFSGHAEPIYSDLTHIEDACSDLVAERILRIVAERWRCLRSDVYQRG